MRRISVIMTAAAGLLVFGLGTAALPAGAATAPFTTITSPEEAGWQAGTPAPCNPAVPGCWHFRYVQAQVALPDVTGATAKGAFPSYQLSVRLTGLNDSAVLGIAAATGGSLSTYKPVFNVESSADGHSLGCKTTGPAATAGDVMRFSLYYDYTSGNLTWNVTDETDSTGNFAGTCLDPVTGDSFTQAQIGTEFAADYVTPGAPAMVHGNYHLVLFTDTVITNKVGGRGSAGNPPGPAVRLQLNAGGGNALPVVASTPFTWGTYATSPDSIVRDGRNFSVWLPAYP